MEPAFLVKLCEKIFSERRKLVEKHRRCFLRQIRDFPTHHHSAPHAEHLQDTRYGFAEFRIRHADQLRGGSRWIQQGAHQIKDRALSALRAKLSRGCNMFEGGMKFRREEKSEVMFLQ